MDVWIKPQSNAPWEGDWHCLDCSPFLIFLICLYSALHSGARGHTEYINGSNGTIHSRDLYQPPPRQPLADSSITVTPILQEVFGSDFIACSGQKSGVAKSIERNISAFIVNPSLLPCTVSATRSEI
jgi:hypothetical protein